MLDQSLMIGGVSLPNRVFLAPMSGVTDEPFRLRACHAGAGLVVSEMVASGELVKGRGDTALRSRRPDLPVHMVQLAGREASALGEAARIAVGEGADIIDINMGCPAKKVTGGLCGSALMRDPDHALSLVEAVVAAAYPVPTTVKMRLGWDETSINAPFIARCAVEAGVQMITVHGRTREQFYRGTADWRLIRRVREAVSVPLVANGDITSLAAAHEALKQSGADAVMVGRAAYGAPWLPGQLAGGGAAPADICEYAVAHYEDMLALHGTERGLRHARKHLGWYLDRWAPGCPAETRAFVMTAEAPAAVIAAMREAFGGAPVEARQAA